MTVTPQPFVLWPPRFSMSKYRAPAGVIKWNTKSEMRSWSTRRPTLKFCTACVLVTKIESYVTASSRIFNPPPCDGKSTVTIAVALKERIAPTSTVWSLALGL